MNVYNINPCYFQRMNILRTKGLKRGGAAARCIQKPPKTIVEGATMPVNPTWLTNAVVRESLAQMEQSIMMQAQAMTAQVNR